MWSRDGHGLFFWNEDKIMGVEVRLKPTFAAGPPRMLFKGNFIDVDVAPDGRRFLIVNPDPEESGPVHFKVVLNWFEDVSRRVPGAR